MRVEAENSAQGCVLLDKRRSPPLRVRSQIGGQRSADVVRGGGGIVALHRIEVAAKFIAVATKVAPGPRDHDDHYQAGSQSRKSQDEVPPAAH